MEKWQKSEQKFVTLNRTLLKHARNFLVCSKENLGIGIIGSQFMDFQAGRTVHTHKTCVHAKYRGMGVGKLLVLASLSDALKRGCTRWLVEVDEGKYTFPADEFLCYGRKAGKNRGSGRNLFEEVTEKMGRYFDV